MAWTPINTPNRNILNIVMEQGDMDKMAQSSNESSPNHHNNDQDSNDQASDQDTADHDSDQDPADNHEAKEAKPAKPTAIGHKYGALGSAMNQYKANPMTNLKRRINYALKNGNLPKETTLRAYGDLTKGQIDHDLVRSRH
jgi:TATA-binding protein-associated factor Taf7